MVVWAVLNATATESKVVGRFVGADGVPSGDDFEVSTGDASDEPRPEVAACGKDFTVVWTGSGGVLERGSFSFLFGDDVESGDLSA
ncbi:MAG: hypothetical protein DWQ36_11395 [Acidobacteria bacterium]|nr:MAG: hypothetical protein DWQ30_17355 [Acidobacteriota bacterium]REK07810.1 MAG: hypothetical protein DWQ36_11395 [Acidobacteriota bacterium]